MSTIVDITGATYPTQFKDKPILPLEGRSLRPAFENKPIERDAIFWEHEGNAAVRVGDLKLVRKGAKGPWELYDMKTDRTELHDLASQQPEKVAELKAKWLAWAERCNVNPDESRKDGKKKKNGKKKAADAQ
jgi:arylsulfatase